MNNRNLIFIITAFIVLGYLFIVIDHWQTKLLIAENNERLSIEVKKSINEQLKLKNAPLIDIPSSSNKSAKRITLTKDQINLINQNIAVNTAKVDDAIGASKDEISRDLTRISIWVAILISAIGIIAIIIPIVINIYSTKDLEKRLNNIELDVNKTLKSTTLSLNKSVKLTEEATDVSRLAIAKIGELTTLMSLLDVLSKLKTLDFFRFSQGSITRDDYIKSYFKKLAKSFESCKEHKISPSNSLIFKEACIDLAITIYQLLRYVSPAPLRLQKFSTLIGLIDALCNADAANLESAMDDVIFQIADLSE